MLKLLMAATAALTLMSGTGFAQSSASTSTTMTTPGVPATDDVHVTTTTKRTATRHGVIIDEDVSGDEVSSPGVPASSRTTTQTTTVR
jgi:hypothetical protein